MQAAQWPASQPDEAARAFGTAAAGFQTPAQPRRSLTKPDAPHGNSGWDNENSDLIIYVDDELSSADGARCPCWCFPVCTLRRLPSAHAARTRVMSVVTPLVARVQIPRAQPSGAGHLWPGGGVHTHWARGPHGAGGCESHQEPDGILQSGARAAAHCTSGSVCSVACKVALHKLSGGCVWR